MNLVPHPDPLARAALHLPQQQEAPTRSASVTLFCGAVRRELVRAWPRASALLLLEIDGFESVAGTLGEPAANAILQQFAARLAWVAPSQAKMGRLAGNRFALLLAGPEDMHQVTHMAALIRHMLETPFDAGSSDVTLTACIGVATCTADSSAADALLLQAGIALQQAQLSRNGVCCFYNASMPAASMATGRDVAGSTMRSE